jgi:hypothetical protein
MSISAFAQTNPIIGSPRAAARRRVIIVRGDLF